MLEMDMELERSLRRALRAQEPRSDFTSRVMTRVSPGARSSRRFRWGMPAALAASLVVAAAGLGILQQQREAGGLEAARQLAIALEITSSQLNQVQRKLDRTSKENGT
jgi:hypothetical protein